MQRKMNESYAMASKNGKGLFFFLFFIWTGGTKKLFNKPVPKNDQQVKKNI
jgi:hypothetical protein